MADSVIAAAAITMAASMARAKAAIIKAVAAAIRVSVGR
jgi:hypothetical protein